MAKGTLIIRLAAILTALVLLCGIAQAEGPYKPTWESLKKHQLPEWFRDAKFGCWACWCPGVVVSDKLDFEAEWLGREMYEPEHAVFKHMRQHYGDQKKFGYKDLIPLLKGQKFDADEWAELFRRAGAKYAGPLAIFHDNYALWDSKVTRYNAAETGPKRDIVGEWGKAVRKRGMKFTPTFHHGLAWYFYEPAYQYDAADPKYSDLYCQPHEATALGRSRPTKHYLDRFLAMVNEVVTQYEPDMMYFDFGLGLVITEEYQQRMFADYYNWAARKGVEVAVSHKHRDIHKHTGLLDHERGREDRLTPYAWQTDTSISSTWFYHKSARYRSVNDIVHELVDVVSKNGCLFLNVPLRADGSIPSQAVPIMAGIGDWLKVNGDAIYSTRPWTVYGEGPSRGKPFTARDIRFTRSKDGRTLYAIVLDWPGRELTIESVQVGRAGAKARVRLLGCDGQVKYRVNDAKQLVIAVPDLKAAQRPSQHAYAFELTGFEVSLLRK